MIIAGRVYKLIILFFTIFSTGLIYALESSYIISEDITFTIKSMKKSIYYYKKNIWIGDEYGKSFGYFVELEDEYHRIKSIKCRLLDKNGRVIKKVKKKNIKKIAASPGYVLYSGDTYSIIDVEHHSIPYMIEYESEIEISSLFFWPNWYPQANLKCRSSSYTLIIPASIEFDYKTKGAISSPIILTEGNKKKYHWVLKNIPEYEDEYLSAPEDKISIALLFEPEKVFLNGVGGKFDTWKNFGFWYNNLIGGQKDLKAVISEINPNDMKSNENKAQILLSYIQNNMRYVAMEEGIHSWKPHKSSQVLANSYGDCKDLTTFYINQLNLLNIKAYPVLLRTRMNGIVDPEMVTNQFNHVIACVIIDNDTHWVDCTAKYNTIYDLPYQVEGCNVLIINDYGGQLVRTPNSKHDENTLHIKAEVKVDSNGNAIFNGEMKSTGNYAQNYRAVFIPENNQERKKTLTRWLSDYTPNIKLTNMQFHDFEDYFKNPIVKFNFNADKYATKGQNRLFINPNFYHRLEFEGEKPEKRTMAVIYNYPFETIDSITYYLPDNLQIEYLPKPKEINTEFGSYKLLMKYEDDKLVFYRKRIIKKRLIQVSEYREYYYFMEAIEKADGQKAVFRISE